MFRKSILLLSLFLLSSLGFSQEVPLEVKGGAVKVVKVDKVVIVKEDRTVVTAFPFAVVAPPDAGFYYWTFPAGVVAVDKGNTLEVSSAPRGDLTINVKVQSAVIDAGKIKYLTHFGALTFSVGEVPGPAPAPTPKPVDPDVKPNPPQPVLSFRVIFVAESGKTPTKEQNSVMNAKSVRDWLTVNTTPESAYVGWRQYDPQQTVANESPNMKKLWEAVQPKLTGLPCVVVEVNGHAEIIPLAGTPAEMVETFKKYKGGA